ncbi:MAG: hypothetical protein RLZZ630_731 [Bacteroidota bacterium]|jgi:hypothetical protein
MGIYSFKHQLINSNGQEVQIRHLQKRPLTGKVKQFVFSEQMIIGMDELGATSAAFNLTRKVDQDRNRCAIGACESDRLQASLNGSLFR